MKKLQSFTDKYKKIEEETNAIKKVVKDTIYSISKCSLTSNEIQVVDTSVTLTTSSIYLYEIKLYKDIIVQKLLEQHIHITL